jgi:hypothetical protein
MKAYKEPSSAMELDEQRATAHKLYVNALVALILIGIELGVFPILWIFVEPTPSQKIGIVTGFLACFLCFIAVAIYFAPLSRENRAFKALRSTTSETRTVTVKRVRLLRFSRGKYDPGQIVGYRLSCDDGARYTYYATMRSAYSAQLSREIRDYLLSAPQRLTVYRGTHLIKTDPYYNRIPTYRP